MEKVEHVAAGREPEESAEKTQAVKEHAKEIILNAAEKVISEQGIPGATLTMVAEEAGFSKGGLLHYFTSKDEILRCLLERAENRLESFRRQCRASLRGGSDVSPRIMLGSFVKLLGEDRTAMRNIAMMLSDRKLREEFSGKRTEFFAEISRDSKRPERVGMAMLMADGWWFDCLMNRSAFPERLREAMLYRLWRYIDSLEGDFD